MMRIRRCLSCSGGPAPIYRRYLPWHEVGRHHQHLYGLRRRPPALEPHGNFHSDHQVNYASLVFPLWFQFLSLALFDLSQSGFRLLAIPLGILFGIKSIHTPPLERARLTCEIISKENFQMCDTASRGTRTSRTQIHGG